MFSVKIKHNIKKCYNMNFFSHIYSNKVAFNHFSTIFTEKEVYIFYCFLVKTIKIRYLYLARFAISGFFGKISWKRYFLLCIT